MNPNEKLTELLKDRFFKHEGGDYAFLSCKTVGPNLMILTNKKTIQIPIDRFVDFYQKVAGNCYSEATVKSVVKEFTSSTEIVLKSSPLQAEIVQAESTASKVSSKLMEIFDSLADNPTEETYKKAQAMVNVSNSIVNVQMAQIKFLMLKK